MCKSCQESLLDQNGQMKLVPVTHINSRIVVVVACAMILVKSQNLVVNANTAALRLTLLALVIICTLNKGAMVAIGIRFMAKAIFDRHSPVFHCEGKLTQWKADV